MIIVFYWIIILLGIVLLTLSISNPFYNLIIKKNLNLSTIKQIVLRIFIFFVSIIIIILGLVVESLVNIS